MRVLILAVLLLASCIAIPDLDDSSNDAPDAPHDPPELADPPTWYVSVHGSDSNDGQSEETAFRTIQHAANRAEPGDVIQILPGLYRERLRIERSGTPRDPIVFQGETGAIIDGGDLVAGWEPAPEIADGVYKADLPYEPRHMTWDNRYILGIIPARAGGDVTRFLQDDIYHRGTERTERAGWDGVEALYVTIDGTTYLRFSDRRDPNTAETTISRQRAASVRIADQSHIVIRGLTIRGAYHAVLITGDAHNNIIEDNLLMHGHHTLFVSNGASGNHLRNNEITLNFIWDELGQRREHSDAHRNTWHYFKNVGSSNHYAIRLRDGGSDNEVYGNYIYHHWDGIGIRSAPSHSRLPMTDEEREAYAQYNQRVRIYENHVRNMQDAVLVIKAGGVETEIFDNIFHEGSTLIRFKALHEGPIYIYRNRISADTHVQRDGRAGGPPGVFISLNDMPHTPGIAYFYHNTFVPGGSGISLGGITSDPPTRALENFWFVNNVFSPTTRLFHRSSSWGNVMNARFDYNWAGGDIHYTFWPAQDNNILADGVRLWDDPANTDYRLPADSAAREAGIDLSQEWTVDGVTHPPLPGMNPGYFSGSRPDMGVFP